MIGGVIRRQPKIAKRIVYLAYYRGFSITEIRAQVFFETGQRFSRDTIWSFIRNQGSTTSTRLS